MLEVLNKPEVVGNIHNGVEDLEAVLTKITGGQYGLRILYDEYVIEELPKEWYDYAKKDDFEKCKKVVAVNTRLSNGEISAMLKTPKSISVEKYINDEDLQSAIDTFIADTTIKAYLVVGNRKVKDSKGTNCLQRVFGFYIPNIERLVALSKVTRSKMNEFYLRMKDRWDPQDYVRMREYESDIKKYEKEYTERFGDLPDWGENIENVMECNKNIRNVYFALCEKG